MTKRAITALFDDYDEAARAVDKVEAEGVPHGDISIVVSNEEERHSGRVVPNPAPAEPVGARLETTEAAGAGAAVGGVLGGGAGLLAGLGLLAIPGIGPAVAAGWVVATLTGAGVGAATGGLLGALTGAGMSDADAETYAEGVRRGGTLVTVLADDEVAGRVTGILRQSGSIDLDDRVQDWREQGWTGGTASGQQRAPATPLDDATAPDGTPSARPTDVEHASRRLPEEIR